ncbi:unnamed protein product, partial [Effrenium voratum]
VQAHLPPAPRAAQVRLARHQRPALVKLDYKHQQHKQYKHNYHQQHEQLKFV